MTAYPRSRPGWPLAATLGVHLLLAWSWRIAHPPAPRQPELHRDRVIDLITVPPLPEMPRMRSEPPASPAMPRERRARSRAAETGTSPEPEPIAPPPETPATVADPFAISAPSAPSESALDAMLGRAKRDAVIIDREMRKGKSGVPEVADTPMGRFRQALEAAHKDSRRGLVSDTYTAPDGQVIYRFRQGGKVWCRTGGSVRPQIGGANGGGATQFDSAGGGAAAGLIRCPSHGDWKRD
ncbi:hypothetical protein [Massilia alkalitolerans]|uniref:hypothetical protein n=1 Tax=Massilia alkalitolerans TaxID=286638 RepID=UPI00047F7CE5|nr:hypothetical protein [Massilia alkalitolerans]